MAKDRRLTKWREAIAEYRRVSNGAVDALIEDPLSKAPLTTDPLAAACKYFALDPNEPSHRGLLLLILADLAFGRRPRGRKKGSKGEYWWHPARLHQLGLHYEQIATARPGVKDAAAARAIRDTFPDYTQFQTTTIRQRLPEARRQLAFVRQPSSWLKL